MQDEDIKAQIASIDAQLRAAQQSVSAEHQTMWSTAQSQQPTPAQAAAHRFSKDTDGRSIFIGNLPKGQNGITTTPEELAHFFSDCGPILNCTVLKDRNTEELKGTAYIEFATYEAAGRAIDTKNNAVFKGSTILVCWMSSRRMRTHTLTNTVGEFCTPSLYLFPPTPLWQEKKNETNTRKTDRRLVFYG